MARTSINEPNKYILLLNDCLKRHLITTGKKEKTRIREKFEFLEAGIWDSGVRVKKLKGPSGKRIFEARLSKGERIIFTLGRHGLQTAIYLWGIVKHDDVRATARHIFPDNAPFLNFEPETLEDYPEIWMDELPEDYFSQEALEEKSREDYGPQKWLVLSDKEWERMLLAGDPENFEIFLFLTSEQSKILETDPPLLLSGTAGSGKTTISVYYLLKRDFLNKKRLFLTYSPYLNEFSQRIYSGLVSRTGLEGSDNRPDFYIFRSLLQDLAMASGLKYDPRKEIGLREFEGIFRNHRLHQKYDAELVWEEIRSIIKGAKPLITVERFRTLSQGFIQGKLRPDDVKEMKEVLFGLKRFEFIGKIEQAIERKSGYLRMDDFIQGISIGSPSSGDDHKFILGEILRVMEKKQKSFTTPLLTYQEYLNLGKKRAPNFLYERKDIYDIAEYYQGKIEEMGQWDEIDLCRQAILHMGKKQGTRFSYDLVVCDEVQDFADIQLSLIFSLVKSQNGIVLTGDPKQIINPSGFRWEEVKNKFYERGIEIPDVYNLNLNFRCVGNIVKLSNALLDLKQQLVGLSGSEMREEWKFNGRPPFLLTNIPEKEIQDRLHLKGAGQIILVRDEQEQKRLKKALRTELIFTINEAKGLEFDTVFLWKFSSERKSADIWRRIKNGHYFDRSHYPHIKHEINLLYVAITRARNTLIIFEPANDVWDLPAFHELLFRTDEKDILSEIWQRISTPEEWERQGDYFFQREYYSAAAECYKNAGNLPRWEIANAYFYEKNKHFKEAAQLFEKHHYTEKAAGCYEDAGLFAKALALWEKLKDQDRIRHCRINLYEQDGEYDKAAEEWAKLRDFKKALEAWKKAGNHKRVGEYYYSTGEYGKAAEAFEAAQVNDKAAFCYKKVNRLDKAADHYYRAKDFSRAIPLYKKVKNKERLLSCYVNSKDYYNAALICEKEKEVNKAIAFLTEFAKASQENRDTLLEEAERSSTKRAKLDAAIRFSALDMHEKSAPLFFEKGYYDLALQGFKTMNDHEMAAECYFRCNDYYQAALEYEESDDRDKWPKVSELLQQYLSGHGGGSERRDLRLHKEAESYFKEGFYDNALVRFKAIQNPERIYDSYLRLERDEEGLRYFWDHDMVDHAERYLKEKQMLSISPEFLQSLIPTSERYGGWYPGKGKRMDFIARLMGALLKKGDARQFLDLVDRFLSSIEYYLFIKESLPKSVLDLMIEARHCNAILEALKYRNYKKTFKKDTLKAFIMAIKKEAEEAPDQGLLTCYFFTKDKLRYEEAVETLPITRWNYKLFMESKGHYLKAVEYLLERHEIEDATRTCRGYGNFRMAAQIYEKAGMFGLAARDYRDGKCYEDAIRCYRKVGDELGIARIHERMKEFDKALTIWKKHGKTREVNRVLKKKEKELDKATQLSLF